MKNILSAALIGLTASVSAAAIEDLTYRQRWPWGKEVDIDFSVTCEGPVDVDITATWDGLAAPVRLLGEALEGVPFSLKRGDHHFVWNPAKAGLGDVTLRNFKITVATADPAARTYLVIDLNDGSYEYLPDVPEGGWTDQHQQTKMVFRRVPAGTYVNGVGWNKVVSPLNNAYSFWQEYGPHTSMGTREVVFTDDFYMAIYPVTGRQYEKITATTLDNGLTFKRLLPYDMASYYDWRGNTDATKNACQTAIDWPTTKYAVAEGSILDKFRKLVSGAFMIDLPTEEQWEVAARAGTTSIYPNGGDAAIVGGVVYAAEFTNLVSEIGWCAVNREYTEAVALNVGSLQPNGWGIYDVVGNGREMVLDHVNPETPPDGTNPVGPYSSASSGRRMLRSCSFTETLLGRTLPSYRRWDSWASNPCAVRLCIHLKSLFD